MKEQVTIVEISPRDGLSSLYGGAVAADKVSYIEGLIRAGLKKIECAAFTHPRHMPEHADAELVMARLKKKLGVTYIGLVPNEVTLVAASDIFTKVNSGRSIKELMNKTLPAIFDITKHNRLNVRSYILTAFGCPYSGEVPVDKVIQLALKLEYMGAKEIVLADTTGMANPVRVRELVQRMLALKLESKLAVHFHNTRGTAILNCFAAYEAGIRIFDTSLGGLSGTPYGAMEHAFGYWNVPTEDLVHLFETMGINTCIDLDLLLECISEGERLAKQPLPGHILRAKASSRLSKVPSRPIPFTEMASGE
jgi:hydroxymethylglutaryl-CoA lyase